MKNKEVKKSNKIIVEGVVKVARYGTSDFDDTNKYRLFLESDNIPYEDITAYETVGTKLTPKWYKDKNGTINLNSLYDIPVMDVDCNKITFNAWVEAGTSIGSVVQVAINQKEGALYPIAIKVIEEGEPYDPFEIFG